MEIDPKLIGEVAAERRRPGFKCLSQPLRAALGPALMRGRNSGASVTALAAAYRLSKPTIYNYLRAAGNAVFGRVQLAAPSASPFASRMAAECSEPRIELSDPRSGILVRVCNIETAAALLKVLREC